MTVAGSESVTSLVRDLQADLGFTFNPVSLERLEAVVTRDLNLGAIMARDHPLAKMPRLSLGDCLAYPVAWPSQGLSLRSILDNAIPVAPTVLVVLHIVIEHKSIRFRDQPKESAPGYERRLQNDATHFTAASSTNPRPRSASSLRGQKGRGVGLWSRH